jgi:hypothetical protein
MINIGQIPLDSEVIVVRVLFDEFLRLSLKEIVRGTGVQDVCIERYAQFRRCAFLLLAGPFRHGQVV